MKQTCKNCIHCLPSYNSGFCVYKGRKTKLKNTCERWEKKK